MEFHFKNDELIAIDSNKPPYLKDSIEGDIFHASYLDYLFLCYSNHYGIVVKPDFIWFTVLCEISRAINENPDEYKSIFTNVDSKKSIIVYTNDPVLMPIDSLIDKLFNLMPPELKKNDIVLNFSTSSNSSKIAFSASFLEAASPFYTFGMMACGFNKINVLGCVNDYKLMRKSIDNLLIIFSGKKIQNYLNNIRKAIDRIILNFSIANFWNEIFTCNSCGSGSQYVPKGWFMQFFDEFNGFHTIKSYPRHISTITYCNTGENTYYKMNVGILSSKISNGYLLPNFEYGINELT